MMKKQTLLNLATDTLTVKGTDWLRIIVSNGNLTLVSSSSTMESKAMESCDFEDMDVCVSGSMFTNVLKYIDGENITLSLENNSLLIKSDSDNKSRIPISETEVLMRNSTNQDCYSIQIPELYDMVTQTYHCVCPDSEEIRAAIYLLLYQEGCAIMSCSGSCVSVRKTNPAIKVGNEPDKAIAVVGKDMLSACKLFDDDVTLYLANNDSYVRFVDDNHEITLTTLSCIPPNIYRFFKNVPNNFIDVYNASLIESLNLFNSLAEKKTFFTFNNDTILMNSDVSSKTQNTLTIPASSHHLADNNEVVEGLTSSIEMVLDPKKVLLAANNLPGVTTRIRAGGKNSPVYLFGADKLSVELVCPIAF